MKNKGIYSMVFGLLLITLSCTKELEDDGFAFFDYSFSATTTVTAPLRLDEPATINFTVEELTGESFYILTYTTSGRGTLTYNDVSYAPNEEISIPAGAGSAQYVGSTEEMHELVFTIRNANQSPIENTSTVSIPYEDLPPPLPAGQSCTTISPTDGIVPETLSASEVSDAICNVMDGDLNTGWTARGDQQWIYFDLGSRKAVNTIRIAFDQGDVRTYTFDIQVSDDAENWTNVLINEQNEANTELQLFNLVPLARTRYVRYLGHGNSITDENSLTEVLINTNVCTPRSGRGLTPVELRVSNDVIFVCAVQDGSTSSISTWRSTTDGDWIQFDLGATTAVNQVEVAFADARDVRYYFDIEGSTDGVTWIPILQDRSSGTSEGFQSFTFTASVRFIRYVAHGSSDHSGGPIDPDVHEVSEINVFGTSAR